MSNDVEIVVTGDNRSHGALAQADQDVKKLGDSAKKSSKDVQDFGGQFAKANDQVRESSVGHRALTSEIDKTSASLRGLRAEFAKTGDLELFGGKEGIDEQERALARLERRFKSFASSTSGDKDKDTSGPLKDIENVVQKVGQQGERAGQVFLPGFLKTFQTLPPQGQAAIVGAVTTALAVGAPAIGAAVNSAMLLGVGGATLALGISRAVHDERVGAAFQDLGDTAVHVMDKAAEPMVAPLIRAAQTFKAELSEGTGDRLTRSFATVAPLIDKLAVGAARFVSAIGPGWDRALAASVPMIEELADELPHVGEALSDMLSTMAQGGPGAVAFFHDLLVMVEGTARGLGVMIDSLSRAAGAMDRLSRGDFKGALEMLKGDHAEAGSKAFFHLAEATDAASDAAARHGENLSALIGKIGQVSESEDIAAGKMVDTLVNAMMTGDQAVLGFAESMTRMQESVNSNGTELDIHTAKGQSNREAVLGMVSANLRNYDALIAAGEGSGAAREAYEANTSALEHQMQVAGFTQGEIDGLIGKYRSVPNDVNTNIQTRGLEEAINGLNDVIRLAYGLPPLRTIVIRSIFEEVHYGVNQTRPVGGYQGSAGATGGIFGGGLGDFQAFASGGISGAGPGRNLAMVGERGRELVRLPFGSTVVPHGQTENMMAGQGQATRGGGEYLEVRAAPGSDSRMIDWVLEHLRFRVRTEGQGTADGLLAGV